MARAQEEMKTKIYLRRIYNDDVCRMCSSLTCLTEKRNDFSEIRQGGELSMHSEADQNVEHV